MSILNIMRIFSLCVIASMLSIIIAYEANACMPTVRTISQKYFDADIVFLGELKKVEELKDESLEEVFRKILKQRGELNSTIEYLYFSPKTIWKGSKEEEVILYRMKYQLSTCDVRFIEGKTYLVYGHANNIKGRKIYNTSWPSGTYLVSDLKREITFGGRRTVAQEFQKLDVLSKLFNTGDTLHYIIFLSLIMMFGVFLCISFASAVLYSVKCFRSGYSNYYTHLRKACFVIVVLFTSLYIGMLIFAFTVQ